MLENTKMLTAKSLIGAEVFNTTAERLATIEDLVVDMPSGIVAYAILSAGGMLGMGAKLYPVPWAAIQLQPDHRHFILDVTGDRLKNAPSFDKNNWPDMSSDEFGNQISGYYGLTAAYPR